MPFIALVAALHTAKPYAQPAAEMEGACSCICAIMIESRSLACGKRRCLAQAIDDANPTRSTVGSGLCFHAAGHVTRCDAVRLHDDARYERVQ